MTHTAEEDAARDKSSAAILHAIHVDIMDALRRYKPTTLHVVTALAITLDHVMRTSQMPRKPYMDVVERILYPR